MPRVAITPVAITGISDDGYNLTDSTDFTTFATGAGNGVSFTHDAADVVVLQNAGTAAVAFSLVTRALSELTSIGGSVTDAVVSVAAGKTHILPALPTVLKQANGKVYIDCDSTDGKILVLNK